LCQLCSTAPAPPKRPDWDARQWLIDNDLWDDSIGMPPEMYDRAADTPRPDADANNYRCSITDTVPSLRLVT
jgi:hypothetical protein